MRIRYKIYFAGQRVLGHDMATLVKYQMKSVEKQAISSLTKEEQVYYYHEMADRAGLGNYFVKTLQ